MDKWDKVDIHVKRREMPKKKSRWKGIILQHRGWVIRRVDRYSLGVHRVNTAKECSYFGTVENALTFLFNERLIENCQDSDDNTLVGLGKSIRDTKQEFGVLLSPNHGIVGYHEGIERLKKRRAGDDKGRR